MAYTNETKKQPILEEIRSLQVDSSSDLSDESCLILDEAGKFLRLHHDLDVSHIDLKKVRRKVDFRIVPIMCAIWIMAFLDKASYNYSAVMGIKRDLRFGANDFANIASASSVALLATLVPNMYLVQRLPASKWLSSCCLAWSVITLCTAAVHSVPGLMTVRILLSIAEATIGPSLMLITAQWYTKSEQAPRFAFWHSAPGLAVMFGGLLSWAFQGIHGSSLASWRWMFICLGLMSLSTGVIAITFLPDTPMQAKFLSVEERVALLRHVSNNMTGVANRKFAPRQLLEAAKDIQVWFFVLPYLCAAMSHGLTGTYSTTIIKENMGYTARQAALLNMPTGIFGLVSNLIVGFGIRRTSNRWAWALGTTVPGIIGASVISFVHFTRSTTGVGLFGIYLVATINSITVIVSQWSMANVAGATKRAFTATMMSAALSAGGIIAPQTFRPSEAKLGYPTAKVVVLASQVAAAVIAVLLWRYYVWENNRRDRFGRNLVIDEASGEAVGPNKDAIGVQVVSSTDAWAGLTDRENRKFRYVC